MAKVTAEYELELQLAKLRAQTETDQLRAGPAAAAYRQAPGLEGVPKDAQVHIVGVYEGKGSHGALREERHSKRQVRVVVHRSNRPIVLALASYEPVSWTIMNTGATISAVLLSGYHPSTVNGTGNAPVLRIGSAYAYSHSSAEYQRLRQSVTQYTGPLEIRSFQGAYSGSDFRVGGL